MVLSVGEEGLNEGCIGRDTCLCECRRDTTGSECSQVCDVREQRRPRHVDDDSAHGQCSVLQFGDAVSGLLDGHLFEQRDEMDRGLI